MIPTKLEAFLASLSIDDADAIDMWLDENPGAVDDMRGWIPFKDLRGVQVGESSGKNNLGQAEKA